MRETKNGKRLCVWEKERQSRKCVCVQNVMCDYKLCDERGIRYVQCPLFSIIWHYPPIFFAHIPCRESRISYCWNSFSPVARMPLTASDLKTRNLTYLFFFSFYSWISEMWHTISNETALLWVMTLAPGCGGSCAIKREKTATNSTKEIFNLSFCSYEPTIRRQCINIDNPYLSVHIEIEKHHNNSHLHSQPTMKVYVSLRGKCYCTYFANDSNIYSLVFNVIIFKVIILEWKRWRQRDGNTQKWHK